MTALQKMDGHPVDKEICKSPAKHLTAKAFCVYNPANMNTIELRTQLNPAFAWYFYFSPPA